MRFFKRAAVVVTALVVLCAMIVLPAGCTDKTEKKAIIILPGIMGSNLIDAEDGSPLWAPFKGVNFNNLEISKLVAMPEVQNLLNKEKFDKEGGLYELIDKLKIKPDGTPNYANITTQRIIDGKPKYDKASTYGTLDCYDVLYRSLDERFGEEYDVFIYEYDWRLDNMSAATGMESFINENGYDSVVLIGHSMGGVMASTYLARSEENRAKCAKFISLGTPYYGAVKAIQVPENPLDLIGEDMADLVKRLLLGNDDAVFEEIVTRLTEFVVNVPTLYQLMPYPELMAETPVVDVDGNTFETYDELIAYLSAHEFCEDNQYFKKIEEWQDEQFVVVDGVRTHVSKLVDTAYFVGTDLDTIWTADFSGNDIIGVTEKEAGDGTVLSYSAACGLPINDERVKAFEKMGHMELAYTEESIKVMFDIIGGINGKG